VQADEVFLQFRHDMIERACGDRVAVGVLRAKGILCPVASDAHCQALFGTAPVDLEYRIAVGILAPVPACRAAVGDGMPAKALQPLPVLNADEIVR
jgi:hypothetical protein